MKIVISNSYNGPIYEQIKKQILAAILSGELRPGELLPSLRGLARDLKVGVLTINRAYTELEAEGYIQNIQGKGCFVAERGSDLIKQHLLGEARADMNSAISKARSAGTKDDEILEIFRGCLKEEEQ